MKLFTRKPVVIPASLQQLTWNRMSENTWLARTHMGGAQRPKTYIVDGWSPNKVKVIDSHGSNDFKVRGLLKWVRINSDDHRPTL
jgi:hypothetical protein